MWVTCRVCRGFHEDPSAATPPPPPPTFLDRRRHSSILQHAFSLCSSLMQKQPPPPPARCRSGRAVETLLACPAEVIPSDSSARVVMFRLYWSLMLQLWNKRAPAQPAWPPGRGPRQALPAPPAAHIYATSPLFWDTKQTRHKSALRPFMSFINLGVWGGANHNSQSIKQ